jgi:Fe-S-cluster containining protein
MLPSMPIDDADERDLRRGLRFAHQLAMAARGETHELAKEVYNLLEVLVQRGVVRLSDLRSRYPAVAGRLDDEHGKKPPRIELESSEPDKYQLRDLPDVGCLSLLPICKGRCCGFKFALSEQDLDEGVVRWDYARPYRIRHDAHGFCVHRDPEAGLCTVHQQRPATCRIYDCRQDRRVWADFAARLLDPELAKR